MSILTYILRILLVLLHVFMFYSLYLILICMYMIQVSNDLIIKTYILTKFPGQMPNSFNHLLLQDVRTFGAAAFAMSKEHVLLPEIGQKIVEYNTTYANKIATRI